jgi:hypothetical protein
MATNTPARRPRRGRPTKLTPEVHEKIVNAVRAGNYLEIAAEFAGVHRTTVFRWLKDAEADDAPRALTQFRDAISRARAEAEVRVVGAVQRDMMGGQVLKETVRRLPDGTVETEREFARVNGRLALEFASRAFAGRWGRRAALEVTGAEGGPVQVEHTHVIASLAERLQETLGEPGVLAGEIVDE